jgi:hypothetical protein
MPFMPSGKGRGAATCSASRGQRVFPRTGEDNKALRITVATPPCGVLDCPIRLSIRRSLSKEIVMNPYFVPVGAIIAGVLVLIMPRLLNYIVALALIAYGLYELNKVHQFLTI